MIDIENELFDKLRKSVLETYKGAYVTGSYEKTPPSFPCISIIEVDNRAFARTSSSDNVENHVEVMYEVNVYSNKSSGRKSECKGIIALIDEQMQRLGFSRIMLSPIPNEDTEVTIYRMVARYRAVISKEKVIYRR